MKKNSLKEPVPLVVLCRYLEETIKTSWGSLGGQQTKTIFLKALKDFFDGKIGFNTLGVVAEHLRWVLNKEEIFWQNRDLEQALMVAAEFNEGNSEEFEKDLRFLRTYYQKNKHLLNP